jgi:hypothetical protein
MSLILFAGGIALFRRWGTAFAIPWPASNSDQESPTLIIEGVSCAFRGYDQELIVGLRVRHFVELTGTVALAAVSVYVLLFRSFSFQPILANLDFFGIEFVCGVGWLVLIANLLWFTERRLLARSYHAVAITSNQDSGLFRRGITYQFLDHHNERHAGYGPLSDHRKDNAVLVFYNSKNPDENVSHGAFLFHHFGFHLISKRN